MIDQKSISGARRKISAQINLSPSDYPLSRTLLERQISLISDYVDEIVLTIDQQQGEGRFRSNDVSYEHGIRTLAEFMQSSYPSVVLRTVDYSPQARHAVSSFFRQRGVIPLRDLRGGPFYVYFYGLWSCTHDLVFHFDSDIFFGGSPDRWFSQAVDRLNTKGVFSVGPLPGPPSTDGQLRQLLLDQTCIGEDRKSLIYEFDGFSTRVFFTDRRNFVGIDLRGLPGPIRAAKAVGRGLAPFELPEVMVTKHMRQYGMRRVDCGGDGAFFTLHPPYKSITFCAEAERIWDAIVASSAPIAQRGRYDICDDFYDFTLERRALAKRAWYRRLFRLAFK